MPKLTLTDARFALPNSSDDRGAITTLFAILLGSGLLMAILGMVVDGGQVMVAKQLVRNAADAVSEAVAVHCAKETPGVNCLMDNYSTISAVSGTVVASVPNADFLNTVANPRGSDIVVSQICGKSSTNVGLGPCPPLTGGANDCQTNLDQYSQYTDWVRVYTSTDPNGIVPAFENYLTDTPQAYQETACSQVYWGKAGAISVDATGNQLPFVFGLCDVAMNSLGTTIQLTGDAASSPCLSTDRTGQTVSSSTRGFMEFDPSSPTGSCWNLGSTTCTTIPLNTTKGRTGLTYPQLGYSALISSMKLKLNRTVLLPVVSQSGSTYTVKSYAAFTLQGFNFPTTSTLGASTTKSAFKTFCPGTPTNSSAYCIAGQFNTRVYGTYGQVSGLGISSSSDVPNLGYQVIKHIR